MGEYIQDEQGKMRPVCLRSNPSTMGFICEDDKGQQYFVEKYNLVVYKARKVGENRAESND